MSPKKLLILLVVLVFKATSSLAQSRPAPTPQSDPNYQDVSVPVPRAVALVTDVARVLFSRNEGKDKVQELMDRRRARSEKRDQSLIFSVPKNKLTRTLGLVE